MNSSACFFLLASAVLVVFTQQSRADLTSDTINNIIQEGLESISNGFDRGNNREAETIGVIKKSSKENRDNNVFPDATNNLEKNYIKATQLVAKSEDTIYGGLKASERIVSISSEAAKQLLQQAFAAALVELFGSAIPVLESIGAGVALSNEAASEGLGNASKFIQEVGFAIQEAFLFAESFVVKGIDAGNKPAQLLLDAVRLAVESSFASAYNNIQQSIQVADRALRNAQNAPRMTSMRQIGNGGNCTVAERDPEASEALKAINEAANNALKKGANADLVKEFEQVLKCSLGDFVVIIDAGEKNVRDVRKIANTDPQEARLSFYRQAEIGKKGIVDFSALIYSVLGKVGFKSGNQSSKSIANFITGFEGAKSKVYAAIRAAGDFEIFGMRYQGDASKLAVKAAEQSGYFGKSAFIQALVEVAKPVFAML